MKITVPCKRLFVVAICGYSLALATGCASPQPEEYAEGTYYSEAMNSYSICQQRRYPVDHGSACDLARPQGAPSYADFSSYASQPTTGSGSSTQPSGPSEEQLFYQYWSQLSEDERAMLLQQWMYLAGY